MDPQHPSFYLCLSSCLFPTFLFPFKFPTCPSFSLFFLLSHKMTDLFWDSSFLWLSLKQEFYPTGCWSTSANVREFQHDKQEGIWNKPLPPPPPWWKRWYPHHLPAHRLEVGREPAGGTAQGRHPELQRPRSSDVPPVLYIRRGNAFIFCFVKGKSSL